MSSDVERVTGSVEIARKRNLGPVLTLLLLSPVIGEVLSGATRLSYIFALVPEIMVWGCGTLLIREVARRWGAGWTSVLLLGFGLAVAEEFIIQQTSIAPLPWLGTGPAYGRVWGVNWPYFLFMLGYEAVWIVLIPIQVTELTFSEHRAGCWLRRRGLLIASGVFLFGSLIAWFLWTQRARPLAFHVPVYHPPLVTVLAGLLAIVLLGTAAYFVRHRWNTLSPGTPPRPWIVAMAALLLGLPWYLLMVVVFAPTPKLPLAVPLGAAVIWGAGVFLLVKRWALTGEWGDLHRWALCLGAISACMTGGFLGSNTWPRMDIIAKGLLNVIAVVGMAWLARSVVQRERGTTG
jgi:hypothetical protein